MNKQVLRFFHSSIVWSSIDKSNLAKLRKKTGYAFANCKKALEQNDNDLVKAEKWLADQAQALGWAKAAKLEGRTTAQGLIGISFDQFSAAMVEVNCETDFVARNATFLNAVDLVARSCLQYSKKNFDNNDISKLHLDSVSLNKIEAADAKTLQDHIALVISSVGENLNLRRATCIGVRNGLQLATYAHPNIVTDGKSILGKYGTMLVYRTQTADPNTSLVARQLCQHIVGMNPTTIGEIKLEEETKEVLENKLDSEDSTEDAFENKTVKEIPTELMQQEFLMDPDISVGRLVSDTGINVVDFVRFECGESMDNETITEVGIRAQQVC